MGWITSDGQYYGGDRQGEDEYIPDRPDVFYVPTFIEAFTNEHGYTTPAHWGWLYSHQEYLKPIRRERNRLLHLTDWTVNQTAWEEYRQQLRDLPNSLAELGEPVWPTPPGPLNDDFHP